MLRALYQTGRIKSPVIIRNQKSFFAQRLGGGIKSSCFARPRKIRPVFDCLCERETGDDFFFVAEVRATSYGILTFFLKRSKPKKSLARTCFLAKNPSVLPKAGIRI